MRKLIICDNEKNIVNSFAEQLEEYYPGEFVILKYISDKQLIYDFEDGTITNAEIVIMDISMGNGTDKDGIEAAIHIREKFPQIKILFLTGYLEQVKYIFRGIEPDGLLLKPMTKGDIIAAIDKVLQQLESDVEKDIIYVKSKGVLNCIPYCDIQYVESKGRKIFIYTRNQVYEEYGKLDEFCESKKGFFLRCHQSYAVNIHQIRQVGKESVVLHSGVEIRISRGRYSQVQGELMQYLRKNEGL